MVMLKIMLPSTSLNQHEFQQYIGWLMLLFRVLDQFNHTCLVKKTKLMYLCILLTCV